MSERLQLSMDARVKPGHDIKKRRRITPSRSIEFVTDIHAQDAAVNGRNSVAKRLEKSCCW
jgi:hypothetical protein